MNWTALLGFWFATGVVGATFDTIFYLTNLDPPFSHRWRIRLEWGVLFVIASFFFGSSPRG